MPLSVTDDLFGLSLELDDKFIAKDTFLDWAQQSAFL
jgi:hypothetical protein